MISPKAAGADGPDGTVESMSLVLVLLLLDGKTSVVYKKHWLALDIVSFSASQMLSCGNYFNVGRGITSRKRNHLTCSRLCHIKTEAVGRVGTPEHSVKFKIQLMGESEIEAL